jgi:hypothetical protein
MSKRFQKSRALTRKLKRIGRTSRPFGPRSKFALGDGSLETIDRSKPKPARVGYSPDYSPPELSRGTPGNEEEDP